jgi:hypothetical protein
VTDSEESDHKVQPKLKRVLQDDDSEDCYDGGIRNDFHTAPKLSCDDSSIHSEEIPNDSGDDYSEEKPKNKKKSLAPVKPKKSPVKSSPLIKKYEQPKDDQP